MRDAHFEKVVATGRSATTEDEVNAAPIELSTIMMAEPGKTISGEDIYNLIQEAKAENVTITSKLRRLRGANIITTVSPGSGVVTQAVRSGRKKRKGGNQQIVQEVREWREQLKRQSNSEDEQLARLTASKRRPDPRLSELDPVQLSAIRLMLPRPDRCTAIVLPSVTQIGTQ